MLKCELNCTGCKSNMIPLYRNEGNKEMWNYAGSFGLVLVFELFGSCHPPVDQ